MEPKTETALLGGGCFWCVEAVVELLAGVSKVESGYAGGQKPNPSYESVCTGTTGHAEVVQVTFDPAKLAYHDLLTAFLLSHDPTTPNRQGADAGTQYRSVIFYHSDGQKRTAETVIAELDRKEVYGRPIVTEVSPAPEFYPAEAYHQEYYRSNPYQSYCAAVIAPKVAKFRQMFLTALKG